MKSHFLVIVVLTCLPTLVGGACPAPLALGPSPTRLVVVVPATAQHAVHWKSFLDALRREPGAADLSWMVYEHGIGYASLGHARNAATALETCIQEKMTNRRFQRVTLIGHSVGGMVARRAYLQAAGAVAEHPPSPGSWAGKVDRILLFTSVNKGIPPNARSWGPIVNWLLHYLPHPHFVLEDFALGSDFIADTRIAWIRHFGRIYDRPDAAPPRIVQFWGTEDSVVTEKDNADLKAFGGLVMVRVAGATHRDLNRLEPAFAEDAAARWALFKEQLLDEALPVKPPSPHKPQKVLFIVRGIRDSSNSEWVSQLRRRARELYGEGNVEDIEYGYFSAARFAIRPWRQKNIPEFRDLYAQRLAEDPLTTFDFIGHSNGTYILGYSLLSTPSMRFRNVVLVAPVLPTDFDWPAVFAAGQVQNLRYDTASRDWAVGILCPALRAFGFLDVGPSGVVLFGEGRMLNAQIHKVGWYDGGHSAALRVDSKQSVDNLAPMLAFAANGSDLAAGEALSSLGAMQSISRATPYLIWALLVWIAWKLFRYFRQGGRPSLRSLAIVAAVLLVLYVLLDVV